MVFDVVVRYAGNRYRMYKSNLLLLLMWGGWLLELLLTVLPENRCTLQMEMGEEKDTPVSKPRHGTSELPSNDCCFGELTCCDRHCMYVQ